MRHLYYQYRMPVPLWFLFKGPKTGSLGIKDRSLDVDPDRGDSKPANHD